MRNIAKLTVFALVLLMLAACQVGGIPPAPPAEPTAVAETGPTAAVETGPTAVAEPVEPAPAAAMASASSLAGTSWVLSSLNGGLPIQGATVTISFGADGSFSGSDGCNNFSTTYTVDGSNLTIVQPMASTMMACPEPIMNQAADFTAALAGVTSFTATPRQLILFAGDDIAATFVAASQDLADTAWDVVNYNNGREAVVGLLLDTEITAYFGVDGSLSGNAGCNQYVGSYKADGDTITIGDIGSTFRFCPEPEGVMQQEQEYLLALQSAATYSIQGEMLQMRTAADQLAVLMTRRTVVDLPAPEPTPAIPTGRVTGAQALNVRSGPGVNFPVLAVVRNGDEGEIVGRSADGRWWVVSAPSLPDGIGWVSADFVLATNAENVPVIAAPTPPPPTATPVPPPPTPTRAPTATPPRPPAPPPPPPAASATPSAQISFWANQTTIQQGQCTTLNWSVENVQAVWVYPRGEPYHRHPRTGQGSEQVCPSTTTTYEMRVRLRDGSTVFREVTVNVQSAPATATPAPPPPPTATPAPAPDPLVNTRWDVVNYNDGNAIVTLLPGTGITMVFGADGQVTGRAGCNTYFASYRASGNSISIGQPGATRQFCTDPPGVMEQEGRFLSVLPTAATLRIDGNRLELSSAGGQIIVVATRA